MKKHSKHFQLADSDRYHEYVPATVPTHIDKNDWGGIGLSIFQFSGDNEGIPAPAVSDYILGTLILGFGKVACQFNSGHWKSAKLYTGSTSFINKHNQIALQWKNSDLSSEKPTTVNLVLGQCIINKAASQISCISPAKIEFENNINLQDPFIHQLALELKSEAENKTPYGKLFGQTAAQLLAIHLLRKHAVVKPGVKEYTDGLDRKRLREVIDYINDNLNQEISLDSLAVLVGMSNYHFARLFKQSTGIAPHKYVVQCRIEKAKEFLKHTNLSISQISVDLGYESQSHFAMLFKRHTGVTPSRYRAQCG